MSLAHQVWNAGAAPGGPRPANDIDVWDPGDPVPHVGEWLLIGVASWSRYDHRLLALLETLPRSTCRMSLFNADRCTSQEAVREYIPWTRFVHHMPIVGYWRDGQPIASENGYAGRHLIYRVLGLDPKSSDEFVVQPPTAATV